MSRRNALQFSPSIYIAILTKMTVTQNMQGRCIYIKYRYIHYTLYLSVHVNLVNIMQSNVYKGVNVLYKILSTYRMLLGDHVIFCNPFVKVPWMSILPAFVTFKWLYCPLRLAVFCTYLSCFGDTVKPLFERHGALFFNLSTIWSSIRGAAQLEGGAVFLNWEH